MVSSFDFLSKNANGKVRKLLGRAYLRESRIEEALEVYAGILKADPDDMDALLVFANLYRLAGCLGAAGRFYQRVLQRNPENVTIQQLAIIAQAENHESRRMHDPTTPEGVAWLAAKLNENLSPERAEEIRGVADMLEKNSCEDHPPDGNGHSPDEMQQLMPALLALNIRQARAAGFPELAEVLQSLQISLTRQVDDRWADDLLKDDAAWNESSAPPET